MLVSFLRIWKSQKLLVTALLLASGVMLFFAVRMVSFWVFWADPAHRNQNPEPWMTPRYIAHSWQLSPREVAAALGLSGPPKPGEPRQTISQIAKDRGVAVETVLLELQTYLAEATDN